MGKKAGKSWWFSDEGKVTQWLQRGGARACRREEVSV
jgi:hypothetical protein